MPCIATSPKRAQCAAQLEEVTIVFRTDDRAGRLAEPKQTAASGGHPLGACLTFFGQICLVDVEDTRRRYIEVLDASVALALSRISIFQAQRGLVLLVVRK